MWHGGEDKDELDESAGRAGRVEEGRQAGCRDGGNGEG